MFLLVTIFLVQFIYDTNCVTKVTLSQKERISILRDEIKKEIRSVNGVVDDESTQEEDDYLQAQNMPITPIMGAEKIEDKLSFQPKTSKSTSKMTLKSTSDATSDSPSMSTNKASFKVNNVKLDNRNSSLRSRNQTAFEHKKFHIRKPIEIFYRRIYNKELMDNPSEWVHCQDMITPYLTGTKKDITHPKRLPFNDTTVVRFMQLLRVDTTNYGRDDIYSILYQINNLHLRLFQWDVVPLNMLLNTITKVPEDKHTFGRLKAGIRELFRSWRMDITNITNLLKQTRIFRPPCLQISKYDGSTKAPRVTTYTKKTVATTRCEDEDDDC